MEESLTPGEELIVESVLPELPTEEEMDIMEHTVTEEDLVNNPDSDLVVGEVIGIPALEEVAPEVEVVAQPELEVAE